MPMYLVLMEDDQPISQNGRPKEGPRNLFLEKITLQKKPLTWVWLMPSIPHKELEDKAFEWAQRFFKVTTAIKMR